MFKKPAFLYENEDHIVHKKILFKNAHIINPKTDLEIEDGFLIVSCGVIFDFGESDEFSRISLKESEFDEVIDCKGRLIVPGLLDIQVHLRDPGQTHKEDIVTGTRAAVKGGITTVVCQPNTSPTLDNKMVLDYLYYKARSEGYCRVFAYASFTKGLKGEDMTDMIDLATHPIVVGFTDDGLPLMNSFLMRKAFENSSQTGKVIAQHAEDIVLSNKGCINEGMVSAKLGVRGIHNLTESLIVERDIALCKAFGGKYHVLHASTKETIDAVRIAKMQNLNVTCEVSPHHLLLNEEAVLFHGTNAKMNPPLRSQADVIALREALFDGTIDVVATDHAPHDLSSKEKPLEDASMGIVGLETMLPLVLKFYHEGKISLMNLFAKLTYKPAEIIGIDVGNIEKGKKADLTIIDLNKEWIIKPDNFESKSKNTPFGDVKVKGIVDITVISGEIVYIREE